MQIDEPHLEFRVARTPAELRAAQRLRYRVFVEELGGDGPMVDHDAGLEIDSFDPFFDHLILLDHRRDPQEQVVGVYRVMGEEGAARAGTFYSEAEYDLGVLRSSGRKLLELGRSCVHPDYRGGTAMMHLWSGLADYIAERRVEVMFGVASFHGLDPAPMAGPLSLLHHRYLAPEEIRPTARPEGALAMGMIEAQALDRPAAIRAMPALIKAYLRLGGFVGEGAFVDRAFNCIDVCLVMDVARMSPSHRAMYERDRSHG